MTRPVFCIAFFALIAAALSSCAGSLAPLYRDFRAPDIETDSLLKRIEKATRAAGWEIAEPDAPNVVSTEVRTIRRWGIYRINMSIDVLPMGSNYVRVIFHPYRKFFTGGRSKVHYLSPGVRRNVVPALAVALEEQGLELVDTLRQRNKDQTKDRIR